MKSDRPIDETLRSLLELQGVSIRELSRRCKRRFDWGGLGTMSGLLNGSFNPTPTAMEHIASVLEVSPEVFAEYRLAIERRRLDPDQAGLKKALKRLAEIEEAEAAQSPEPARHPAKDALRRADSGEQAESS